MQANRFLLIFFLISICHLIAILLSVDILRYISKPLIMISLGLFYWMKAKQQSSRIRLIVGAAILFSLAGDLFLMALDLEPLLEYLFLLGLASFLFAHISYILGFWKTGNPIRRLPWIPAAFLLAYLVLFLRVLWPDLPKDLRIPVSVYGLVICMMAFSAIVFTEGKSKEMRQSIIGGAFLFILSDSLIAIGKFSLDQNLSFAIMLTYILAQWQIISGLSLVER